MFVLSTIFSIFFPYPTYPLVSCMKSLNFLCKLGVWVYPRSQLGVLNRFCEMVGWVFHLYVAYLLQCALVWGALALPSQLGLVSFPVK